MLNMNRPHDTCRKILFAATRLGAENVDPQIIEPLIAEVNDSQMLLNELEKNGLAPLFYSHLNEHNLALEPSAMIALKALVLRHQSVAKARYQAIQELSQIFAEMKIPWIALKGLALASSLYSKTGLRPMRDMDILVPQRDLDKIAKIMRDIGYDLPEEQPSKYMRGTHQLPNAEKKVNGFKISIEIHHNAISQDANDSLTFSDVGDQSETVQWDELSIPVLSKELMLHQLCRHLEALHPGGNLKLINVIDVVGFSEKHVSSLNWIHIGKHHTHILNTLRCLAYIMPLSSELKAILDPQQKHVVQKHPLQDVGVIMMPLGSIFSSQQAMTQKMRQLLSPSDWWLHLYYGIKPSRSLFFVKTIRHPLKVGQWLLNRFISRLLGG